MLSFFTSLLPTSFLPEWLSLEMNPLDCVLQGELFSSVFCCVHLGHSYIDMTRLSCFLAVCPAGLIGACGISVLCSLMRVHLFLEEHRLGICLLPDLALETGFITQHTEKIYKFSSYSQNASVFCISCLTSPTSCSDKNEKDTLNQKTHSHQRTNTNGLYGMIQFFFVTVILTVVGSRVASLVVLEFCLRAVSGWVTAGPVRNQLSVSKKKRKKRSIL